MSDVFEYHFTVGDRDADGFGLCRASALLGYLQDAAAGASGTAWTSPMTTTG